MTYQLCVSIFGATLLLWLPPCFGSTHIPKGGIATPYAAVHGRLRAIAEFEQTDAVLLAWEDDYASIFTQIVSGIRKKSAVYFLLNSYHKKRAVIRKLRRDGIDVSSIRFIRHRFDSMWTRDYGPISVRRQDGSYALINNNYAVSRPGDDDAPFAVAEHLKLPVYDSGLSIEGGNFMTNGQGLCITTTRLEDSNPEYHPREISMVLGAFMGCEQTITLEPLAGEETGHVDIFAKFISSRTVLVGQYEYEEDPENAWILDQHAEMLKNIRIGNNETLNVVRMPMGSNEDGIFRSYLNSLYVNETLIMPTYRHHTQLEKDVIAIYQGVLPQTAQIVKIDASELIELEGAIHCITLGLSYRGRKPRTSIFPM